MLRIVVLTSALLCVFLASAGAQNVPPLPPTPTEIIRHHGYVAEEYSVTTPDGYVLKLNRIPPCGNDTASHQIVFLQHGILGSSADFLLQGPQKSLPFQLAESGYDVWMGNFRGNVYSRKHNTLSTRERKFWDFEWHEMGVMDLPTMVDYVLSVTGERKLHFVGHSTGATAVFVLLSMRPEYNKYFRTVQALAPVTFMKNVRSPFFKTLSRMTLTTEVVSDYLGHSQFVPSQRMLDLGGRMLCKDHATTQSLCLNTLFLVAGFDSDQLNKTLLPEIFSRHPAGASVYEFVHYAQEVKNGNFAQYDHGTVGNLKRYGSTNPPSYELNKVAAPVTLHYAQNDWLASVDDVERLAQKLPNCTGKYLVSSSKFSHYDFVWGADVKQQVYDKVLKVLNKA
ncbi:lipase 3-like isoform X2 [Phlebotomus argentipes]|uniref:lipase 3-like isoform X2 n=1 Tax=Phlebotomus argentipes TaxID=94469 RepID=UPI0028929E01|nr:lipase 3-like isoform X2 [Phlebotomus argentipes]